VSLRGPLDGSEPVRPEPLTRPAGPQERRRTHDRARLASGTLACPACDAPVVAGPGPTSVGEPLACGFCSYASVLRDFLSLGEPTRPKRVSVNVRRRR
jgi:hypothetical protein